jgi:pyruvate formate lyase activating enzyme
LCDILLQNVYVFIKTGGGITFSGGEPLAQYDFLKACLQYIGNKMNRAIQTSGMCDEDKFYGILQHVDYVLYDLKIIDEKNHIKYTGLSNTKILKNFETLCNSNVPFCVRTPLIPTITDTKENIQSIAWLLQKHGLDYIELLPYNKMAGSKYKMSYKKYNPPFDETLPVEIREENFAHYGITANIL